MSTVSRTEAQRRADEIRVFREELARLEAENVLALTAAQREPLTRHHESLLADYARAFDIDRDRQAKQLSLGMRIASLLGALALAASVFFLFNQYWGLIPTTAQVVLLIAAACGTLVAVFSIARRDSTGYFAKIAATVAFACFVLNVSLLGQIFNVTPSDTAFVPWAALAFVLAYTFELRLLLAAGILCAIGFLSARVGAWCGLYWLNFGERPENFFPAAVLLFLVPSAIPHARFTGFSATYRVLALFALLLPILVLSNWGAISYLTLDAAIVEGGYQVLGFAISAALVWLGARRSWPEVVHTGTTFFIIFLFTKFFDWWWDIMPKFLFFLVIALTAILFILIMKRLRIGARVAAGAHS